MTQQVGKHAQVTPAFKEFLGKEMTEGMRVHLVLVKAEGVGHAFQTLSHTTDADGLAVVVKEKGIGARGTIARPVEELCLQALGEVDAPHLVAF